LLHSLAAGAEQEKGLKTPLNRSCSVLPQREEPEESRPLLEGISRPYDLHDVSDVTRLLDAVERGEPQAAEELLPLVYEELRRLAAHKMTNEKPGQTLQPTALVHEVWLRLIGSESQTWENRRHFFCAAAEAMRRILVERARARGRQRRGGDPPALSHVFRPMW
jgi:hypothetical protein